MHNTDVPYHLVNTNVVLVDAHDSSVRLRGGDSFILSPKYCGSRATGWIPTTAYMEGDVLTLATAIAISGAAANPNAGFGGLGPTRTPLLSLLMGLLNIRLGYWVPCPGRPRKVMNHFRAAYHELSRHGYSERQDMVQLSDGGHFENLGVYELVRRKVKLIVCCDGSADPKVRCESLQVLVRRIGADFGARIIFDDDNHSLDALIPSEPDTAEYPMGVKFAERGYTKGTISYRDGSTGALILVKSTMVNPDPAIVGAGLVREGGRSRAVEALTIVRS